MKETHKQGALNRWHEKSQDARCRPLTLLRPVHPCLDQAASREGRVDRRSALRADKIRLKSRHARARLVRCRRLFRKECAGQAAVPSDDGRHHQGSAERAPFGYRLVDESNKFKELEVDEDEAKVVRRIFEMYDEVIA